MLDPYSRSSRRGLGLMLATLLSALAPGAFAASESNWDMDPFRAELTNQPSLQNGAKLYMNYCIGCHSLKFQRYQRTAEDIGIPLDIAEETLIFTGQKIGGLMESAMPAEKAKAWFGGPPPDLTMVSRVRGSEWLYNYLRAFYIDESRPFGVNNGVFENVGMPHVLLELQGRVQKGCYQVPMVNEYGGERRDPLVPGKVLTEEKCDVLKLEEGSGSMTAQEYDSAIFDLVNFLVYVGEPYALQRQRIGVFVLLFLVVLFGFAWLLNREYWKDVEH
ncbi:MAG: cytochrome c1 [Pseudomonadota bacterium]